MVAFRRRGFDAMLRLLLSLLLMATIVPLSAPPPAEAATRLPVVSQTLAVAANYTLEIRSDGTLWTWGNGGASLGLGFGVNSAVAPTQVGEDTNWVFVEADGGNSFAIKADGTLWAWGSNNNHALGLGDTDVRLEPTQVNSDTDWIAVACSGGNGSTFALKADGSLWAWGYNNRGELGLGASSLNVPTPVRVGDANDWVHLAASHIQAAAIKADGTLWAWGQNYYGNLGLGYTSLVVTTPTQVAGGDWVAVSTGIWHTAGIKADGSLWAWGQNDSDLLGVGVGKPSKVTSPMRVGDANDWMDVSAGFHATLGTRADGSAWGWGYNGFGQLGIGTTVNATAPTRIGVDNDWVRVASSTGTGNRAFGMKADCSLYGWGSNPPLGRLGVDSTADEVVEPMLVGSAHGWIDVAEGRTHTLAVRSDGTLWAAGHNQYGRLGLGIENEWATVSVYTQIGTDTDWAAIAADEYHNLALKTDGTLWAWGSNEHGGLGVELEGAATYSNVPMQVGEATDWAQITVGTNSSYAIKADGTLWAWGWNRDGQLGLDSYDTGIASPQMVDSDVAWIAVDAAYGYAMGVKADGTLWGWGDYSDGRIGIEGLSSYQRSPLQVGEDEDWVAVSCGNQHSLGLKADGTIWGWGRSTSGQLGLGEGADATVWTPRHLTTPNWTVDRWVAVSASEDFSHAIAEDGTLWAWGDNGYYRLGDGTTDRRWEPVQVGEATDWVTLTSHDYTSRGIRADGSVWAWGQDDYASGIFGDGGTGQVYSPPRQVAGGANGAGRGPIAVSAGREHTLALKGDGTLWAWGRNNHGQLGFGDSLDRDRPERVGADDDWVVIATGYASSYGLKADGTLWAWGWNEFGQLGLDDTVDRDEPTLIDSAAKWVDVAAGDYHALAIAADGTLWAWGSGGNGQLGTGDYVNRSIPAQVASDLRWTAIAGGNGHTLALKSDGSLWSWGINASKQLGHDDYTMRNEPEQVGVDTEWTTVTAGSSSSYALRADGTMWSWGSHNHGRLGHTPANSGVPSEVPGHSDWVGVAGGGYHAMGIKADGTAYATGDNEHGQLGLGDTWPRDSFTAIEIDAPLASVAAAWANSFAVGVDGTLWAWGDNTYGQLGLGDTEQRLSPEPVIALGDVIAPLILAVRSETHPVAGVAFASATFTAKVSAVDSGSGVAGYSWVVDQSPDTVPDTTVDTWGANSTIVAEDLGPGTWHLHVRAVDAGGNAGPVVRRTVILAANTAPVAVDDAYETAYETALSVPAEEGVLANDTDADGDPLSAELVTQPANGVLVFSADGGFVYTPDAGFSGTDAFTYRATDGTNHSDIATVTLTVQSEPLDPVIPIQGDDRFETAVAASFAAYPLGLDPDGAKTAVIATGMNWPDALGGTALAGALDAPVLFVRTNTVPGDVLTELERLKAEKVIILGGEVAVGPKVVTTLEGADLEVERIWGDDRYETADAVALRVIGELGGAFDGTALLATGRDFADAVAAAPLAAAKHWPLYLAHPLRGVQAGTRTAMNDVGEVLILGGEAAVSGAVETYLEGEFGAANVDRRGGENRYETAVVIATYGVEHADLAWNRVGITTGEDFPDALAGGVLQGRMGSVMLLTRPTSLRKEARDALLDNAYAITTVTYFGGDNAVAYNVRAAVEEAAGISN